ncbi:hypothetical protein [Streptomyces sp. BE133]|uniref:hypothetical protein n=1 Tax=Streptomyces sp. BE133 TaxID=3002523 RepID=UPI002E793371|nr:hypothetical protein [Streptomyces sp. BE133]MEE1807421.1 hypothetical protein [Streptomyces sp. BE133]
MAATSLPFGPQSYARVTGFVPSSAADPGPDSSPARSATLPIEASRTDRLPPFTGDFMFMPALSSTSCVLRLICCGADPDSAGNEKAGPTTAASARVGPYPCAVRYYGVVITGAVPVDVTAT